MYFVKNVTEAPTQCEFPDCFHERGLNGVFLTRFTKAKTKRYVMIAQTAYEGLKAPLKLANASIKNGYPLTPVVFARRTNNASDSKEVFKTTYSLKTSLSLLKPSAQDWRIRSAPRLEPECPSPALWSVAQTTFRVLCIPSETRLFFLS